MEEALKFIFTSFSDTLLRADGIYFWGALACYAAVALFRGWKKMGLACLFPANPFKSQSARLDFQIFFLGGFFILYPLNYFVVDSKNRVAEQIAIAVTQIASPWFSARVIASHNWWVDFLFTLGLLIAADFGWTLQHILFHRVERLWEFHKVHHSATELTLLTATRLHPFEQMAQLWATGISMGIFIGLVRAVFGYQPSIVLILNVSWALAAYRLIGIFRHSHLWIPFPNWLSRLVCSPAMHHIHHSMAPQHLNKNFCNVFSFWDGLFGTLYIPVKKEALHYGIDTSDNPNRNYQNFWTCLIHPFLPNRKTAKR